MNIAEVTKDICAILVAATISLTCVFTGNTVRADTMSDLEAKQAKLEQDRRDVEEMLAKYENDAEETEKYLEEYDNKMKLQEEQVAVIKEQIALCEEEIAELEADIEAKEADVEESVEKFKQRLRTLYMAGGQHGGGDHGFVKLLRYTFQT